MGFLKKLFGKKNTDNKLDEKPPRKSRRCIVCSRSQTAVCKFPYSSEEEERFVSIAVLFHKGLSPSAAVQQLLKQGWNPQCARNCVNLTYSKMETVTMAPKRKQKMKKDVRPKAPLKKIIVRFGPRGILSEFGGGVGLITRKNPALKPKTNDPDEIMVTKLLDDVWSQFGDGWMPQEGVSTYHGDDFVIQKAPNEALGEDDQLALRGFVMGLLKREGLCPKGIPCYVTWRMSNPLFAEFIAIYVFETEASKEEFVARMS